MSLRERNTRKGVAALTAVLVHAAVITLLFFLFIPRALPEEEDMGGILVNIGDMVAVQGGLSPEEYTLPPSEAEEPIEELPEEPLLTQTTPEAPAIPPQPKPKEENNEAKRQAEIRRQEELKRQKAEEEARKRQEAIRRNVTGAFGSAQSSGTGESTTGETKGKEGSKDGNVARGGVNVGVGGFGSYSLAGRQLIGSLPRPSFSAQVEGTIVVQITVDPSGKVISTNLGTGTTISDYEMRQSAMKAARSARFTETDGINNQIGTITYRYRLK